MSGVGYEQDATDLIMSQLRLEQSQTGPLRPPHAYFQVEYMTRQVVKMNPEEAEQWQRSAEQENVREYIEETRRDKQREDLVKHDLRRKFFKLKQIRPLNLKEYTLDEEPIEILKSFSQPAEFLRKSSRPSLLASQSALMSTDSIPPLTDRSRVGQKTRYAQSFQQLLDESQKLAHGRSRYKLVGGTMIEKQKINELIMRGERKDILEIIRSRDYSLHRPQRLEEISNKEKYSMGYLDYMRTKTKLGLDKTLFEKKIRKINGRLENFQEFILREGKMKEAARAKLENFYIKMREEFRRIERSHSPKRRSDQMKPY